MLIPTDLNARAVHVSEYYPNLNKSVLIRDDLRKEVEALEAREARIPLWNGEEFVKR